MLLDFMFLWEMLIVQDNVQDIVDKLKEEDLDADEIAYELKKRGFIDEKNLLNLKRDRKKFYSFQEKLSQADQAVLDFETERLSRREKRLDSLRNWKRLRKKIKD